jgi:hypothetical protein
LAWTDDGGCAYAERGCSKPIERPARATRWRAWCRGVRSGPFADHSAGRLDQPLANGITEDVIRALGRHPALEVVAYDAVSRMQQSSSMVAL